MLFKAYISGYTSGLVSAHSEVKILLNQPIAQDKIDKIESLDLFSISPNVKGKVVCTTPTEVVFYSQRAP